MTFRYVFQERSVIIGSFMSFRALSNGKSLSGSKLHCFLEVASSIAAREEMARSA